MSNKSKLDYIQLAKNLTKSDDITVIISAAKEIEAFMAIDFEDDGFALPECPIEFMEQTRIWSVAGQVPLVLYDYQKAWVEWLSDDLSTPKTPYILITARQMGGSTIIPLYGLWEALRNPWSKVILVASRFANAKEHLDRLGLAIDSAGIPIKQITRSKIVLENNSEIEFVSYNDVSQPGYRDVNIVMFMDAAYYPHSRAHDLMNWTQRQISKGAKVLVVSSAGIAKGFLYDLIDDKMNYPFISSPWHHHPERNQEWFDHHKLHLSAAQLAAEMDCQFISLDDDQSR